ncbi:trk system potassium uptake protein TrkA [Candidatus Frackibacter sp. WG12]|nr:MAG: trk system potassium uptake protein TrkA [Candidatus Frackibacter sp. T328-2]SDC29631.1 trk system potassium uptake protein TrkA [Candidatus Frackibacter sp. WG11]SEM94427.1 trk system potassium uptake protein TrkA [Candidatus Frackibacter sp. WG12]SFL57458.1 trk system potassium uptake protein TrkA [Candidatus Frackibacter sp. WG13]
MSDDMKQFIVIGLGRFGTSVAATLAEQGHDVLAIDRDEDPIQEISNLVTHAVQADATDEDSLKTLGVNNFDVAVVSIGDDVHSNILATLVLKELGVPYVVVKAQDNLHGKVLSKIGADKIVYPERDMGTRVAHNLVTSNVLDYIELAPDYSIIEVRATTKLVGKTLRELALRVKFGVNVIAIKKGDDINVTPEADDRIEAGDILVVMGKDEGLDKLREY